MGLFSLNSDNYLSNVIFLGRNKAYGAFLLRKNYPRNIFISLLIANVTVIIGAVLLFFILKSQPEEIELYKMVDYKTSDFSLEEVNIPRIEQKVARKVEVPKAISENATPVVKEDQPEEKIPEKTDEKKTEEGNENADKKSTEEGKGEATENLKSVSSDTSGTNLYSEELFMKVEIPAEFPGGPIAFGKFIGENVQYPDYAKKNKVDGIVYIHMIINNDGSLTDLKISRGIEESCNNEVLRIMKLSPKWIPARHNGKYVRQRLIVPVRFRSP